MTLLMNIWQHNTMSLLDISETGGLLSSVPGVGTTNSYWCISTYKVSEHERSVSREQLGMAPVIQGDRGTTSDSAHLVHSGQVSLHPPSSPRSAVHTEQLLILSVLSTFNKIIWPQHNIKFNLKNKNNSKIIFICCSLIFVAHNDTDWSRMVVK